MKYAYITYIPYTYDTRNEYVLVKVKKAYKTDCDILRIQSEEVISKSKLTRASKRLEISKNKKGNLVFKSLNKTKKDIKTQLLYIDLKDESDELFEAPNDDAAKLYIALKGENNEF